MTLSEFYKTLLRDLDRATARHWFDKLQAHAFEPELETIKRAMDFLHEHKREKFSVFDCVGYIYSLDSGYLFVTGDKSFKDKNSVLFIPS